MDLKGKATIHPQFFYTGKISGYVSWIFYFLSIFNIFIISRQPIDYLKILSHGFTLIGLIIVFISLINLGGSTRLGLPSEKTYLKTKGLYRFSRNPIYLGFNLFTLSSMIFTYNIIIAILGIYSIVIYHFIIIGEEKFLEKRFGNEYIEYKKKVRRYIWF